MGLCKKYFFDASRLIKFKIAVFFMILGSKIMKNSIYLAGHCPGK